jgi:hypothetical protein
MRLLWEQENPKMRKILGFVKYTTIISLEQSAMHCLGKVASINSPCKNIKRSPVALVRIASGSKGCSPLMIVSKSLEPIPPLCPPGYFSMG